jgi:hypothetical protein
MIACSGYRPTLATVNAEWLQSQVSLLIGNLAAELHDSSREADLGRSLDRSIHDYRRNWLTVYFEYHFFVGPCSIATAGKRELALFSMKISARNFMSAIITSSLFALMSILSPVAAAAADLRVKPPQRSRQKSGSGAFRLSCAPNYFRKRSPITWICSVWMHHGRAQPAMCSFFDEWRPDPPRAG